MEKVIAVFDIGKTNKKILLFNSEMKLVKQSEQIFPTVTDEDGFECDDIEKIENWIHTSLEKVKNDGFKLGGVNFSTYGASLVWLDKEGKRLTPVYNYLKPADDQYQNFLFDNYGGETEFCRSTASPALGVMLNSGIQISWIKDKHPKLFSKSKHILHFPQYLSSLLTHQYVSELTSIGCHTFLWDFDKMKYHQWLSDEGVKLPEPISNDSVFAVNIGGELVKCGVGIHDSSASLVPYLKEEKKPFLLISTGTWCINMNPFNHSPLTVDELRQDSLCYLSVNQQPVKSSRFFMGHIHDVNVLNMSKWFGVSEKSYKSVSLDKDLLQKMMDNKTQFPSFFKEGMPEDYLDEEIDLSSFPDFQTAYHQLMFDLTHLAVKSIQLVLGPEGLIKKIFISGGFARNTIFVQLMKAFLPNNTIMTSEVDNSSALGAALVIADEVFPGVKRQINLGLNS